MSTNADAWATTGSQKRILKRRMPLKQSLDHSYTEIIQSTGSLVDVPDQTTTETAKSETVFCYFFSCEPVW